MSALEKELVAINQRINRWRAFEAALWGAGVLLAGLVALALVDVWLRPQGWLRHGLSAVLWAGVVAAAAGLARVLARRRNPAAVAALLEARFPQLDNHLINRVLFASDAAQSSPWLKDYMKESVPGWQALPLSEMKDRTARRNGAIAVAGALAVMGILFAVLGRDAWGAALVRVCNPASKQLPPTFASMLSVAPGNVSAIQGDAVEITVTAKGRAGQEVTLEVHPEDSTRSVVVLGAFDETDAPQSFVYTVPKLTASVKYAAKAGDAFATEAYRITAVAPLAVEALAATVTPPAYTRAAAREFNAIAENLVLPHGSAVRLVTTLNRAAADASVTVEGAEAVALSSSDGGVTWGAEVTVAQGALMTIQANDTFAGRRATQVVRYERIEDQSPIIIVTQPIGKATLAPGDVPKIMFEVRDDYGINEVVLESIARGADASAQGDVIARWPTEEQKGDTRVQGLWTGTLEYLDDGRAFRLVAYDNRDPDANRAVSAQVVFDQTTMKEIFEQNTRMRGDVQRSLSQLAVMQRENYVQTGKLISSLPIFDERFWREALEKQQLILTEAVALYHASPETLGGVRAILDKAKAPMQDAVAQLEHQPRVIPEGREVSGKAIMVNQKLIYDLLTTAQEQAGRGANLAQNASALATLLDGLLKGQTDAKASVEGLLTRMVTKAPPSLITHQENVQMDFSEFLVMLEKDAAQINDEDAMAVMLRDLVVKAEELDINTQMLRAKRSLDRQALPEALPYQAAATNGLTILKDFLADWKGEETKQRTEEIRQTMAEAKETLQKLQEIQKAIVKTMEELRAMETQGDKTDKDAEQEELFYEEYVVLKEHEEDLLLKVATDLQAIPELDAVNQLVADVYQIYESMAQEAGSEKNTEASELGLQKEDFYLDAMNKAEQKLDEMENWLPNTPDDVKRNIETFDQAEVQNAIPKTGMPDELMDLIGELLTEQDELAKDADDSYTNQGDANPPVGWEIAEGETVDYSAAGKSGNRPPDHKDQDGRSQVGRQGMADGEVMAGSGKINEGDEEIDARRTADSSQSGEVEEEGHRDAVATGGGKNSGFSDRDGMSGNQGDVRRKSSMETAEAQKKLSQRANALYAQIQLANAPIPAGLDEAVKNIGRAAEAGEAGHYAQMREFQNRSIIQLVEIENGFGRLVSDSLGREIFIGSPDADVASTPDEAPPEYRNMVSEYFRSLNNL
ncbi:MAG: hypothetical protein FWF84_01215 [Kiritimatiellaeota bacterium]|nr:hypothetical protein [Kiritimatiellota bacterium]